MSERWTRTTCAYCGVGCGILARPMADGLAAEIKGDEAHPANFGRLCSKGAALGETLSLGDRLLDPIVHGVRASWNDALDVVANRFSETIAAHGPDSVALYVSGQLLIEDYYVANKLMKGFLGSANIDTNSRLCMASSVAGHRRAFGSDTVPGCYADIEEADLVVIVGSNLAWCHPVLYQRLASAREARGTRIVVIDPRRTMTSDIADTHLAIAPGSDVALFNGLLAHLAYAGLLDRDYVVEHTIGYDAALAAAGRMEIAEIARVTALETRELYDFYDLFARTQKVVTIYSQGVNQSSCGTDKVNAVINCHLATGRIGKPGMGPLSVTGQPNAMGGREVGGLANMLAAHMDIDNEVHRDLVSRFWRAQAMPVEAGPKAVDMFRAVASGRIKALWIIATNPVVSLPDADGVRAALEACPFVVVSDVTQHTDTAHLADVLLPAAAWGEKDGTVTNSERRISRQRAFLPAPGHAKPDWWQIAQVAQRLGFGEAFAYTSAAQIFREYAELTGYENGGSRDLDISAHADLDEAAYTDLAPFQWPQPKGGARQETRFFANGGFYTADRRARFIAVAYKPPAALPNKARPLVLNTGRIRDQWHTMTRTGTAARLMNHIAEPFVEIHPEDAIAYGLRAAMIAEVESAAGSILVRVVVTDRQRRGSVFVPMHWSAQMATRARVDSLVAAFTDPISGQPELKHTPVSVRPFKAKWHAFAAITSKPSIAGYDYAALAPIGSGYRVEIADMSEPADWQGLARMLLGEENGAGAADIVCYQDEANGQHRFAAFRDDVCIGLVFFGRGAVAVSRTFASECIGGSFASEQRIALLAGRPGDGAKDRGRIVCSCMGVGMNEIIQAVDEHGCATVGDVGARTAAGTNCGSCRGEIAGLIRACALQEAV